MSDMEIPLIASLDTHKNNLITQASLLFSASHTQSKAGLRLKITGWPTADRPHTRDTHSSPLGHLSLCRQESWVWGVMGLVRDIAPWNFKLSSRQLA